MIIKNLDEQKPTKISDLFSTEIIEKTNELIKKCQQLIFNDFENIGKKCREILWRKGCYNAIAKTKNIWKKNREPLNDEEKFLLKEFLLNGISILKEIILKFEKEFELDLRYIIDFKLIEENSVVPNGFNHDDDVNKKKKKNVRALSEINFALETVHSFLISIGDLHRYFIEFDLDDEKIVPELAAKFYYESFKLNPSVGMPQNQLGTLFACKNYDLDSAYHYLFSMICKQPFELSENNFQKIFQTNANYLESLKDDENCPLELEINLKDFTAKFILIADIFFFDKEIPDFNDLCHILLIDLRKILTGDRSSKKINESFIFKIISILFFCMSHLQSQNSKRIHNLNAFLVAITNELIDSCLTNAEKCIEDNLIENLDFIRRYNEDFEIYGQQIKNCLKKDVEQPEIVVIEPIEINKKKIDEPKKKIQKIRRRRRRIQFSDDSDSDISSNYDSESDFNSNYESEEDSIISESEEEEEKTPEKTTTTEDEDVIVEEEEIIYLNGNSSTSDRDEDKMMEKLINLSFLEEDDDDDDVVIEEEKIVYLNDEESKSMEQPRMRYRRRYLKIDPNTIIKFGKTEKTIKSLKLLFDWLKSNQEILISCYHSNPEFIHKIMKLLNILNLDIFTRKIYFDCKLITAKDIRNDLRKLFDSRNQIPIEEDIKLKHLDVLKETQINLDWEFNYRANISENEENILRVFKMVDFGFHLCKMKKFNYNFCAKSRVFIGSAPKKERKPRKRRETGRNRIKDDKFKNRRNFEEKIEEKIVLLPKKGYLKSKNCVIDDKKTSDEEKKYEIMGKLWLRSEVKTLESKVSFFFIFTKISVF